MNVLIIVNIVISLALLIGGGLMRSRARSADRSVGFKTARALASGEAWRFANQRCSAGWITVGITAFVLTAGGIFFSQELSSPALVMALLLILQLAAAAGVCIVTERQLAKFDDKRD